MLYSAPLGRIFATDGGTVHTLYTVPSAGGPAVVRSCSILAEAGAQVVVLASDGTTDYGLVGLDNTSGVSQEISNTQLYQPLEPGWSILAYQNGSPLFWSVLLGGYQFSTP